MTTEDGICLLTGVDVSPDTDVELFRIIRARRKRAGVRPRHSKTALLDVILDLALAVNQSASPELRGFDTRQANNLLLILNVCLDCVADGDQEALVARLQSKGFLRH